MKPFDLEAAKRGDPICIGDGRPAKFIAHISEAGPHWRVLVMPEGEKCPAFRHEDGKVMHLQDTSGDLFMAPKKRTVWVNLYHVQTQEAYWYDTQEQADQGAGDDRIGGKAWPLEIEA